MAAIILCETTAALTWFLERSRLSVVYPGAATSAFPRELIARIQSAGESIGMAVASVWVLTSYLERLEGKSAVELGPDEPLIFNSARLLWRESHSAAGRGAPLVNVLSQWMIRGHAEEQRQRLRHEFIKRLRMLADDARNGRPGMEGGAPPAAPARLDPYQVLGVSPNASRQEIRNARKARALEYHPDRVANLGQKLKQVAEEETRMINAAYEMILRKR